MPARKRTPDRIDYASCAYKQCTWVMGELAILNVPRDVLSRMQRLAAKGDGEAQRWFQVDLWNEPVALGFAQSRAHPGGNLTGTSNFSVEIAGKRVELLRELVTGLRRLADWYNPSAFNDAIELKAVGDAATRFGMQLLPVKAQEAADYDKAAAMTREWTTHAVYISSNPTNYANRSRIIALMAAIRMPAIYYTTAFVMAGGLI